jgi:hypothetical protein
MYIEILDKASAIANYISGNLKEEEIKILDFSEDKILTMEGYSAKNFTYDEVFVVRVTEHEPVTKKGLFHK